jgi:DNA topoisomerase-3
LQSDDKWRVYELICRHFLACCSKNAKGSRTTVKADMGPEGFTVTGLVILERNFLDVYPYQTWTGYQIPNFGVGDTLTPSSVLLHEGQTAPPDLLAEHDLIAFMNASGIGTDATIPEHIAKVQARE